MAPPKSSSYQRGGGLGSDPGHAGLGTPWCSPEEIEKADREKEIWVSWLILGLDSLIHTTSLGSTVTTSKGHSGWKRVIWAINTFDFPVVKYPAELRAI